MPDLILPPGLSAKALHAAQAQLEAVVGRDNLFLGDSDREAYADKFAIDESHHQPLGGVAPASGEEVQAIVRIAAEHRLPLWPISRGKNLGYGGTAPQLSGSLVLDLSRMKRIEVDPANGTVLLESDRREP